MIIANIKNSTFESFLPEKFLSAFKFLKETDFHNISSGTYNLGNGVRAIIQEYTTSAPEEHPFESHERFFDIQYIISGREFIGVCKRDQVDIRIPYSPENDITFYNDPEYFNYNLLEEGDYMLLAPSDVHKPCVSVKNNIPVRKVVVKIPF